MRIALDTNIIIDILQQREPFFADSYLVLLNALENGDLCMMPVSAMTDVAYIMRKTPNVKEKLVAFAGMIRLNDVNDSDFEGAVSSGISDFEDALLAMNAKRHKADCIVTRNAADFEGTSVRVVTPKELLAEEYGNYYERRTEETD